MRKILALALAVLTCVAASAQSPEEFFAKYSRQVKAVGYDGVGVEGILDKWESAYPEDEAMLEARFYYYLVKCKSTEIVKKDQPKFMGNTPVLSLPDSSGVKVNYFQEDIYDEEYFSKAMSYIEKAIALYPDDLLFRSEKVTALLGYEKESPDMTFDYLMELVEYDHKNKVSWKSGGMPVEHEVFVSEMQNFCYDFYLIASPSSFEAFYKLSEKMAKYEPKETCFLDNIGSYWLVVKGNDKKALKFYKKALKINPEDKTASSNIKIIERRRQIAKK